MYANNFTVTIDQNITVNSLRNKANGSPSITAGGKFVVASSRTITATAGFDASSFGASSWFLEISATSGTVTLNGAIFGAATFSAVRMISGANCTLNVNGDIYGGFGAGPNGNGLEVYATSPTINVTAGYVQGDTGGAAIYLYQSNAVLNVSVSHYVGWAYGDSIALVTQSGNSAAITVTGALIGGQATGKHGVNITGAATSGGPQVTIVGTVSGGTNGSYGVSYNAGNVIVDGEVDYYGNSNTGATRRGVPPIMPTSDWAWAFALKDNGNKKFTASSDAGLPSTGNAHLTLALTGSGGGGSARPASGYQWPRTR